MDDDGAGTKVLSRLATDLRAEFPTMQGFSRANLFYMRRFAEAWPEEAAIVQRPVEQLPWGHIAELVDKLDDQDLREWYAAEEAEHGWSRSVLAHQITTRLHDRQAAAPSNFGAALARRDSELAQQLTKDPFALQFLAIDSNASERELEDRLVADQRYAARAEPGIRIVGRQVHFDVDGDHYYLDLLLFRVEQLRYVVIELETTMFDARDAGQLGFYVALVEDRLRIHDMHQPTVGMLLVAEKNDTVVRYALAGTRRPVAVSRYDLTASAQAALPAEEALTRATVLGVLRRSSATRISTRSFSASASASRVVAPTRLRNTSVPGMKYPAQFASPSPVSHGRGPVTDIWRCGGVRQVRILPRAVHQKKADTPTRSVSAALGNRAPTSLASRSRVVTDEP